MAIVIRGRNQFEVYLIMFWTIGWPVLIFSLGDKLTEYIPETVLIVLGVLIYISAFFIHFVIMRWYYKLKFNKKFNVTMNQKEYNYISKHLLLVPNSKDIDNLSMELRKALFIYLAYSKDKKKRNETFVVDSIKILQDNNLLK